MWPSDLNAFGEVLKKKPNAHQVLSLNKTLRLRLAQSLKANYPQHKEIAHYHLSLHRITSDPFKPMCFSCSDSLGDCSAALPGGNEVLGQVDADRCSCNSDMTVACPVQLAADLDLSSRHLPDLIDLGSLTADYRANQLQESRVETDQSVWWKKKMKCRYADEAMLYMERRV